MGCDSVNDPEVDPVEVAVADAVGDGVAVNVRNELLDLVGVRVNLAVAVEVPVSLPVDVCVGLPVAVAVPTVTVGLALTVPELVTDAEFEPVALFDGVPDRLAEPLGLDSVGEELAVEEDVEVLEGEVVSLAAAVCEADDEVLAE